MELHLPTLFAVQAMVSVFAVLFSITLYLGRHRFPGAGVWILAEVFYAVGIIPQGLRGLGTPYPLIALFNVSFILSGMLFTHSVFTLRGWKRNHRIIILLVPIFYAIFLLLENSTINTRIITFSLLTAAAELTVFFALVWKQETKNRFGAWVAAVPFLMTAIGLLVRLPEHITGPEIRDFMQQGPINRVSYLFSIMIATVSVFGYYILSGVRFENVISEQAQALKQQIHIKDQVMSIIAHDLRAPIAGAGRLIRKNLIDAKDEHTERQKALQIVAGSLERMSVMLENLLWWGRSQETGWNLNVRPFSVKEAVYPAVSLIKVDAELKGVTIEVGACTENAYGDPHTVELVVRNLLSNAVKFSRKGQSVQIRCQQVDERVRLFIEDKGIGIPDEMYGQLFDIDRKPVTKGTAGEPGSGLGLILSRAFALRNNGNLWLEKNEPSGTRAVLELPFAPRQ